MKFRTLTLVIAALTLGGVALADGLLGGGGGNNGGGGGGNVGSGGGGGGNSGGGGGNSGGGGGGGSHQGGNSGGNSGGGHGSSSSDNGGQRVGSDSRSDRGNAPITVQSSHTGRSGRNTQSTRNNNERDPRAPIVVDSIPARNNQGGSHNQGSIRDQARNEDRAYADRYRNGYYQYNNGWRDCDFWYPYYGYGYQVGFSIGPFYFYTNLPGYINTNRIQYTDDCIRCDDWRDFYYDDYDRYDRRSSNYTIYQAINDLEDAFMSRDLDALDSLIPRRTWITITDRTDRNYRLRSEDFYDMMSDLVTGTRTREFTVNRVQTGRGLLRLNARHIYQDAWRQNRTVYMSFTLKETRSHRYQIAEFETSGSRY